MACWALSYKIAIQRGCHPLGLIITTCGTAILIALFWILLSSSFNLNPLACKIGFLAGVALFFAMITYFDLVKKGARLGVSWTIVTLSMIIPTSASIFYWKEIPNLYQGSGLILAIGGILLLGQVKPGSLNLNLKEVGLLCAAFFLTGGISLTAKMITAWGLEGFKKEYILFLYGGTFLPALLASFFLRRIPRGKEFGVGIGMGIAGLGGMLFFLLTLENLSGAVAFPLRTCGSLLLTIFLSFLLWRERLNRREMTGLFLALAAIVLMGFWR